MIRKLIPVLLALIGLGGGVGAGLALKPAAEASQAEAAAAASHAPAEGGAAPEGEAPAAVEHGAAAGTAALAEPTGTGQEHPSDPEGAPVLDYVKLNNQFVIPIVENGAVRAMVILALSLEVSVGGREQVYAMEPKLRDTLLQVLFNHANSGGFKGTFTDATNMVILRDALREAAIKTLGSIVTDVLIIDMARQDL